MQGAVLLAASQASPAAAAFSNWVELRDAGVVRQQWDFSCGLASLATLLKYRYGLDVDERQLLEQLRGRGDGHRRSADIETLGVSLADLAWLASRYGLRARGLRVPLITLRRLTSPVIVYLEQAGQPHFAVLRGIDAGGRVLLADPAAGNRRLGAEAFARWYSPRGDGAGNLLLLGGRGADARGETYFGYRAQPVLMAPRFLR